MTAHVIYEGGLHTSATHIKSGNSIVTDAPVDNNGKGEAFSPTDLASTSLAVCMLTVMGIYARNHGLNMDGAEARVTKHMVADPRRISRIEVEITMPPNLFPDKEKKILQRVAETCPVALSLHPDIKQDIEFIWQ
ncbi:MAG TPA: OsmC family protein [Saprospiraceae bacterium]|nr:OsmC family protein [Saprospiraceae bacterium]